MTEREISHQILYEVLEKGVYLKDAFSAFETDETAEDAFLSHRAAVEKRCRGVVERHVTLDALLGKVSNVPVQKIKKPVYLILLLGLYELFFLDTAPYAAVSEAVKLAVKKGFSGLKNYVNGVLRTALREKERLLSELSPRERISFPPFLYEKFVEWYGEEETIEIGSAFLSEGRSRLTVRRTVSKVGEEAFLQSLSEEEASAVPTGLAGDTYELVTKRPLTALSAYQKGWFYVQDASSACLGAAVAAAKPTVSTDFAVLDACSAPGGKILHLADLCRKRAQNEGRRGTLSVRFLALDVSEAKVQRIRENIERLGFPEVRARVQDGRIFVPAFEQTFSVVMTDVPCSGLGVLSRKPDIKERISEQDLQSLTALQTEILENNARYVKPGGLLVYSTCTLDPDENEGMVSAFLMRHPAFHLKEERLFLPGRDRTDGFYYALMEREAK